MSEIVGVFCSGVALGGVVFGLLVAAHAWDKGYEAGWFHAHKVRSEMESALVDSIQEVLK